MKITKLFQIPEYQLKTKHLNNAFVTKVNERWVETSTKDFIEKVNTFSRGLLKLGVQPGEKIALISHSNQTDWHVLDYGIQQVGAISVPVYPNISPKDYNYIFNDSEVKFCFVSNKELYDKVDSIRDEVPSLKNLYILDKVSSLPNWSEILDLGKDESTHIQVEESKSNVKESDIVTLIYTSGTTGFPKGVILTHHNLVSNILASATFFPEQLPEYSKALSFLPICHVLERMVTYLYQYKSMSISFAESLETIADNLKEVQPHVMTAVPRLLEKVFASIDAKGKAAGGIKTILFNWSVGLVEDYDPRAKLGFVDSLQLKIARKLVFSKWKEGLGGNLMFVLCGAAALSPRIIRIFHGAGIPILEAYGMTETSPAISASGYNIDQFKIGYVGKILSNLDVKIAEDGEICVKGPSVTQGYYNNPEKTAELFDKDGYLQTGDIGIIDPEGFLKITDRKKEMFKTSGGKYIAPQLIENELKQISYIEQIIVCGEGKKMPTAIIQPNFDNLELFAKSNNIEYKNIEDLIQNDELNQIIQKDIDVINEKFGKWEQVKKVALTSIEWTIEDGLLTPTMKMKRKNIMTKFNALYEKLYD